MATAIGGARQAGGHTRSEILSKCCFFWFPHEFVKMSLCLSLSLSSFVSLSLFLSVSLSLWLSGSLYVDL